MNWFKSGPSKADIEQLIAMADVYRELRMVEGKRYHEMVYGDGSRDVRVTETAPVEMMPLQPEELAKKSIDLIRGLDARIRSLHEQLSLRSTRIDAVKRVRDEELKRLMALEAELKATRESLRDKLAACAMQPLLEAVPEANPYVQALTDGLRAAVAEEAYRMADAMLAQRTVDPSDPQGVLS